MYDPTLDFRIHISFTDTFGAEYGADEGTIAPVRPTYNSGATFVGVSSADQYVNELIANQEFGLTVYTNLPGWLNQA